MSGRNALTAETTFEEWVDQYCDQIPHAAGPPVEAVRAWAKADLRADPDVRAAWDAGLEVGLAINY